MFADFVLDYFAEGTKYLEKIKRELFQSERHFSSGNKHI